ncbi:MAG: alpha/beta fold hydrolase [Candidatus Omnitrophota bacterium]
MKKTASLFLICLLAAGLTGCSSVALDRKAKLLGFGENKMLPKAPIVFVHGLNSSGEFWSRSKIMKKLGEFGFSYGGDLKVGRKGDEITVRTEGILPATMYTVTFSNNQMAIVKQGRELAEVIKKVREITGSSKVILIGHSMGGLAAREYLQSDYYQHDVRSYISFATPQRGSDYDAEHWYMAMLPFKWRVALSGLDTKSDAVRDLKKDSIYLNGGPEFNTPNWFYSKDINGNGRTDDTIVGLNDFKKRPLPEEVVYISILGAGNMPVLSTKRQNENSDGVVEITSQDLNAVPGVNVNAMVLISQQRHVYQNKDVWVILQLLRSAKYILESEQRNAARCAAGTLKGL